MKRTILYSVCIGSLALALTAGAQQVNDRRAERTKPQHRTATVQPARPVNTGAMRSPHTYNSTVQYRQRSYTAPRNGPNAGFSQNSRIQATRERNAAGNQALREQNFARNERFRARRDAAMNPRPAWPAPMTTTTARDRNFAVNPARQIESNRQPNVAVKRAGNLDVNRYRNTDEFRGDNNFVMNRNRNFAVNRTRNFDYYRQGNVRITNNWRSEAFGGQRYTVFRNYQRQWHDRGWWRSHYDRIVFVGGGWYYWNAGYWFPAWGYDPYVTYVYDGPIYAYNGFTPDQVTVDVQEQLATAGYYDGPIDGVLGPMTREAIADFQADNGLAITSAIDEPTLATLGLV